MKKFFKEFFMFVGIVSCFSILANLIVCLFISWKISIDTIFAVYFALGVSAGFTFYTLLNKGENNNEK